MRHDRREAIREADVVLLGGSVADFRLSYGRVFSKKSKVIAINRSREQLFRNAKMFWNPALAIQADSAQFFVDLSLSLEGFKVNPLWIRTLRDREEEKEKKIKEMAQNSTDKHLNPLKVI